jgi:hypothetical protein
MGKKNATVNINGVLTSGKAVNLTLPENGDMIVRVASYGKVVLTVFAPTGATGRILLQDDYDESAQFAITGPGDYTWTDGQLLLPYTQYVEVQLALEKLALLIIGTRQKLNVLLGLPENAGLDFE